MMEERVEVEAGMEVMKGLRLIGVEEALSEVARIACPLESGKKGLLVRLKGREPCAMAVRGNGEMAGIRIALAEIDRGQDPDHLGEKGTGITMIEIDGKGVHRGTWTTMKAISGGG